MQYLKKEVREKILAAAIEEFKEYGYADASIRNIANNAEISLGNIYRYFTNKEALYFAVINPFMDSVKRVIEKEFVFDGRTMKEVSEALVGFLMQYSDELIIIRKGNSVHYEAFVKYIVDVTSRKVREMMTGVFPEIDSKINNLDFYDAIAEGFLTALFKILRNGDSPEVQERNSRELITFFFGHMKDRFYHFDTEE
ncbi:MAG: TetR/AcrR family transcriptional regulator [Corallococcus sp.]|nr:TetR/AcrR family transcriptional regulator [Corallococcus sp.]